MRSSKRKNVLFLGGPGVPTNILTELLANDAVDSNIYLSFPLGIMTLAGWCRQEFPNFHLEMVDATLELHKHLTNPNRSPVGYPDFLERLLDGVACDPDIVAVSINFSNGHKSCLELCRACKERWPKCTLIAGGVHATTFTGPLIKDPNIDYIIRGPADVALVDALDCMVEGCSPCGVPGVVVSTDHCDSMAVPLDRLDQVPPYPYDLIDMDYLVVHESSAPVPEEGARTGVVLMSRGCPFGCSYCSADKVHGRQVRFMSVERVVEDIAHLVDKFGINTVAIFDDLFGADKQYFREFFRQVESRNLAFKVVVPGGLSIAVFEEWMIDTLVEHGLNAVYFPLESGSRYVQQSIIKKRVDLDKAVRLIRYAKQKGLFVGINMVLGHPGETKELMGQSLEFIRSLTVDWTAFFIAHPYPGTEMTDILLKRGDFTQDELIEIWDCSSQSFKQRPFDTPEITGRELAELVYDMNIEVNFFSNYNIRTSRYADILPRLNKIVTRYPFHVVARACRARCCHALGRTEEALDDVARIQLLRSNGGESKRMYDRYEQQIREILEPLTCASLS